MRPGDSPQTQPQQPPAAQALPRRRTSSSAERGGAPLNPPYFWDSSIWDSFFGPQAAPRTSSLASSTSPNPPPLSPIVASSKTQSVPTLSLDDLEIHTVALDETFDSIALKHNMSAVELRRCNPGVNFAAPAVPGQELHVKRPSKPSAAAAFSAAVATAPSPQISQLKSRNTQPSSEQDKVGVQRDVLLCMGGEKRVPGRLVVGVQAGFVLFEPADSAAHKELVFALDRNDVVGCCALSRVSARLKSDSAASRVFLQLVWKNAELGFASEQEIFFNVAQADAVAIVEAIYANQGPPVRKGRTMTSGLVALRALADLKDPISSEELLDAEDDASSGVSEDVFAPPQLIPRESHILSALHTSVIASALPERLHGSLWKLLWDFDKGGVSLHALYAACKGHGDTLLVISDLESGQACGMFANETWEPSRAHTGFFGSGECFVFSVEGKAVGVHKWSQANEFILSCSAEHIGIGGGGSFALCIDGDLQNATCGPSLTFLGLEKTSLMHKSPFRIGLMELWGFEQFAPRRDSIV